MASRKHRKEYCPGCGNHTLDKGSCPICGYNDRKTNGYEDELEEENTKMDYNSKPIFADRR